MATNKRKQDEKHLKMLREMVALPHNKQCYDCHQRGPTYVNMTIGSFVCTSCSGILRGLNPPHRVKSISMTSFTPDEMEFLRCHGNDFCKKVWLGLYDSRSMLEPDSKDENKIKDFMIQKYEKKRWYVAPTEQMKEDARKQNTPAKAPETKPLKTLVGNNVPRLVIQNHQSTSQPTQKAASQPGPIQAPAAQAPAASQASAAPAQAQQPKKSSAFDLLGDLGGDPFASPAPAAQAPPGGGFADFTSFNSQGPPAAQPATQPAFPTPAAAPGGGGFLQPLGTSQQASSAAPAPSSTGAFGAFTSSTPAAPPASVQGMSASDKYAALADLDSVFGTTSGGQNVNWNSSGFGGGMSTATSMSNRGPTTSATTQANTFAGTAANPFGGSGMAQTQTSTAVGNPFIGGSTVGQPGFGQPGFPPPGGNVGQYGNVPQPAAGGGAGTGGFGQFGAQPVASSAGFGQFGTNSTTSMATGQFGMQNGNFGTTALATGGWGAPGQAGFGPQPGQPQMVGAFGQPAAQPNMGFGGAAMTGVAANQFAKPVVGQPGFGAQPQQPYGAWPSQQPAGNPFMSAGQQQAAPPRGSSTNPFL